MQEIQDQVNKFRRTTTLENGDKATVRVLRMIEGVATAKKLLNVIAPAVGGAADGMRHDDIIHGAPRSFTNLALTLCGQIEKVQIEDLIVLLLDDMQINGKDVDINDYFAANYGQLVEVLEFSLRENFSSFFTGKGIKARFLKTVESLMAGQIPQEQESQSDNPSS